MPDNDHHTPQFILRGFASRVTRGQHYVFLFRRDQPGKVSEPNTRNVATVAGFYGAADAALTRRESEVQAAAVQEACRSGVTAELKPAIVELVTTLNARSRNLRTTLVELGGQLYRSTASMLGTGYGRGMLVDLMVKVTEEDPAWSARLAGIRRGVRRKKLERALASGLGDRVLARMREQHNPEKMATDSHISGLSRVIGVARPDLMQLDWTVHTVSEPLILGDAGPLAVPVDGSAIVPLFHIGQQYRAVLFPLSSQHLLVGGTLAIDDDTVEQVNVAGVEVSREFFVSSQNTDREKRYAAALGSRAEPFDDERWNAMALEALKELLSGSPS